MDFLRNDLRALIEIRLDEELNQGKLKVGDNGGKKGLLTAR